MAPISNENPIGPNEVLAVPSTIADNFCLKSGLDMPVVAPSSAQTVQDDTAVHGGTEVRRGFSSHLA